jgi:hypothetical protein
MRPVVTKGTPACSTTMARCEPPLSRPVFQANYTLLWYVEHACTFHIPFCVPVPAGERWTGPAGRGMVRSPGVMQAKRPGESGWEV